MTVATPDLSFAPGCFGLAMTYREKARECSACPFATECAPRAARNLAILREELGIAEPAPVLVEKLVAKTVSGAVFVEPMPKKVAAHIERLDRLGIKVSPALERGENPIDKDKGPQFLRVACHLLLKVKAGFSRDLLVQCFMEKLKHTPATAAAHAKQTVQIFEALGVAHEHNGLIQMKAQ